VAVKGTNVLRAWQVAECRRKLKARAVEYKGGQCEVCGYCRCIDALDFHHNDPTQKDFQISTGFYRSWELVQPELDKCKMLCANCHREEHAKERAERMVRRAEVAQAARKRCVNGTRTGLECAGCQKPVEVRPSRLKRPENVYCSDGCYRASQRKAKWPRKQRLAQMVWRRPVTKIAAKLGVSDAAVKKMCRRLGIETPPRGYWAKQKSNAGPPGGQLSLVATP